MRIRTIISTVIAIVSLAAFFLINKTSSNVVQNTLVEETPLLSIVSNNPIEKVEFIHNNESHQSDNIMVSTSSNTSTTELDIPMPTDIVSSGQEINQTKTSSGTVDAIQQEKVAKQTPTSTVSSLDYKTIVRKLVNFEVTWEELSKQGIDDDNLIKDANLTQYDLVDMLDYREIPYTNAKDYIATKPGVSDEVEFFTVANSNENQEIRMYMFDEESNFCGGIQFGKDGMGLTVEQVPGVSYYYGYGDKGFMFSSGLGTTTIFFSAEKPTIAYMYTRYDNDSPQPYVFPVSSKTAGSATVLRNAKNVEIMNWNVDVDGDGVTDVSFGHEGPDESTFSKMLKIIISDENLSESERKFFKDIQESNASNQ
jgi:hypothetical protein